MNSIFINFINYGKTLVEKLSKGGNVYKILGIFGIAINHLYLDFLKHINSLSVFKNRKSLLSIFLKRKSELSYLLSYDSIDFNNKYLYDDYESLIRLSFDLDRPYDENLRLKFIGDTTKKGMEELFRWGVIYRSCYQNTFDDDFCRKLVKEVYINILSIENEVSDDGSLLYFPETTYSVVFYIIPKTADAREHLNTIKQYREFLENIENFKRKMIFYDISAII